VEAGKTVLSAQRESGLKGKVFSPTEPESWPQPERTHVRVYLSIEIHPTINPGPSNSGLNQSKSGAILISDSQGAANRGAFSYRFIPVVPENTERGLPATGEVPLHTNEPDGLSGLGWVDLVPVGIEPAN